MFDMAFAKAAIREVIKDQEIFKKAVIYAIEEAYKDHDQAKGITDTAAQSTSLIGGWVVSGFKVISKYEPIQGLVTTDAHTSRLSNASSIKDDVKSGKISPMMGLWKIGQEGHWSEGGVIYTPSFNTKAMRYFMLYCIEHCYNIKTRNDVWADDPKGIDRESKKVYQLIIDEHVLLPKYQVPENVALNSSECANLLVALSSTEYSELFKGAVLAAADRAYAEFEGLGIRKTYNYADRIANTSYTITCLRNNEISAETAFRWLADEGEWNSRPSSMYNSFNTMFIAYLIEYLSEKLPELKLLKDYSLYLEINNLPDNKRDLFGISKKIFIDYMQIGFNTYKQQAPEFTSSSVEGQQQSSYQAPPHYFHDYQSPPEKQYSTQPAKRDPLTVDPASMYAMMLGQHQRQSDSHYTNGY